MANHYQVINHPELRGQHQDPTAAFNGQARQHQTPFDYHMHDRVRPEQIKQGAILRLPLRDNIELKHQTIHGFRTTTVKEFCGNGEHTCDAWLYNHPVLVISRSADNPDYAYFCRMTTLGGTALKYKFRGENKHKHQTFLPVHPSEPHPLESHRTLRLAEGAKMPKNSKGYVRIDKVFEIPIQYLGRFYLRGQEANSVPWNLDQNSFDHVLQHVWRVVKYSPPSQQYRATHEDYVAGAWLILNNEKSRKRKYDPDTKNDTQNDKIFCAVWNPIDRTDVAVHLQKGISGKCEYPSGKCADVPTLCHWFRVSHDPSSRDQALNGKVCPPCLECFKAWYTEYGAELDKQEKFVVKDEMLTYARIRS